MSRKMVEYNMHRSYNHLEEDLVGKRSNKNSLDWIETLKSFRDKLRIFKENNENTARAQEIQAEVNVVIL